MAASSSLSLVSSSSSSLGSSSKYQVFLSFKGEDTRKGFTGHLYGALKNAGIHTFMDDEEIEVGEKFSEVILKAIEESMYYVVILSKGYANSKWCLKELTAMVDHMMKSAAISFQHKKKIIPVFYYVEPSNVRHQRDTFEKAFEKHKVDYKPADVVEWRQAMNKVGGLKGLVINDKSNKKEVEVIQEIVKRVGRCRDNVILPVAEHPVGIDSRVEEVLELLSIEEECVKMVGIYGMGGVGKTNLAKEIHNRLQGRFEKAIYIECIKDKKDRLPELQEEFISKAFKEGNKKIRNPSEGSAEIKSRFPGKRVLAILDDVDDGDQLKALAGSCDWFGEGTRILITTRDEQLLDAHRHVAKKYQVHELNSKESLHLFSQHAFNSDQPSEEFMEISKKIVKAAGGLPLALEVLGVSLSTETQKEAWEEVETKLRNSKYFKIDKCLRISYVGLSQNEQKGFLDIACFFVGKKKDEVIDIWKGCDFDAPVSTVNSLLHKCLIKVDDGYLYMHDLLRDMGRVIGSRSRLWDQKKVWEVLEQHKRTDKIKGIICEGYPEGEGEGESFDAVHSLVPPKQERASVDVEAFANMSKLQLLVLKNINLKGDFSRMPRSLRSLEWTGCSMKTLPDNFHIQKLGCLKLGNCDIVQFWSDSCISKKKVFSNLKVLDLRNCYALTLLPDFSHDMDLEKLCIGGCRSLTDIPVSIGKLTRLKRLMLYDCTSLAALPDSIGNLTELRRLDLSFCNSLSALPSSIERLTLLEELELYECTSLSTLPDSIGNLTKLRRLYLSNCESLCAFPHSIGNLTLLEELKLYSCRSLSTLPDSIGNLTRLRRLDLYFCDSLSALPSSIGRLTLLEESQLIFCKSLSTLPDSIGNLTELRRLNLSGSKFLLALPSSIGRLTLLEVLNLSYCRSLSTLPVSIENLTKLGRLYLSNCQSLFLLPNSIENLTLLEELQLFFCISLFTLPSSIGGMRRLSTLNLHGSGIEELPDSVRLLESLEWLNIAGCRLRSRLPISEMKCLKGLIIGGKVIDSDGGNENEICEISDGISDNDDGGRMEVCEFPDGITHVGGEVNQKDESDNDDGSDNQEDESDMDDEDEIPYGITHYSRHTQECRRIRYIEDWNDPVDGEPCEVFELSIWVVSGRERKIILLLYPSWKRPEGRLYWNGPWLKHIFPDDFTRVDDTKASDAYASSSPAPDISKKQLRHFYRRIDDL